MKLEQLVGDRFKERPSDCVIDSHALMLRGGYMKYVANGIYSSYLPLRGSPARSSRSFGRRWTESTDRKCNSRWCCPHRFGRNQAGTKVLAMN